eukprot:scaffold94150_cov23-Cyclotella_meneghiniana.AAC.2
MAEIEEINPDGTPTGNMITPPPPYKNTTLRRELAGPMLNNQPLFYTGVVTAVGSDTGISRLVYPYNPKDPANSELRTPETSTTHSRQHGGVVVLLLDACHGIFRINT